MVAFLSTVQLVKSERDRSSVSLLWAGGSRGPELPRMVAFRAGSFGGTGHVAYVEGLRLDEEAPARWDRREWWFSRVSGQVGGQKQVPDPRVSQSGYGGTDSGCAGRSRRGCLGR